MRKNGFTLIELLAVIVILAIIALIAVPIVLNIIEDAKEESNKRSIELYAEAVKQAVARYQINNPTVTVRNIATEEAGKTYIVDSNGENPLEVEYDGNVTCEIIKILENGNIYIDNCTVNGDKVEYAYGTKSPESVDTENTVYFDVAKGVGCTKEEYDSSWDGTDYSNSYTGYNGIGGTGNQNSCLKFYSFNDNDEDTINLLLDHNTTATTSWDLSSSGLLGNLKADTESWVGTIIPENYNFYSHEVISTDGMGDFDTVVISYTIPYKTENYKARLLNNREISQVEEWLYDRTSINCEANGCPNNADSSMLGYGYWTSTADPYDFYKEKRYAVRVSGYTSGNKLNSNYYGVRPVIEVYKSSLN